MQCPARRASSLDSLRFNNVALSRLPVEDSGRSGSRSVPGACYCLIRSLRPLPGPRLAALSGPALALLGLEEREVLEDPRAPDYLSGSAAPPGSRPAAHCYAGHQFGLFAGQLGDGAVLTLGEVESPAGGRWEVQVKGAGATPFSRDGDGRKVLRSSVREFLCSEAMAALGVPGTRAAGLVTSDLFVSRDPLSSGRRVQERCATVLRLAPSFIRFGSFQIFLGRDQVSGLQGPSAGRLDLRARLLDYVIETFYPQLQQLQQSRRDRNLAFFKEVADRTAGLVAHWQSVGFCHGVLNTDNMSILGLTLDYGPFGFMDRFDPDFVCNASDRRGRYSYRAQPAACRWNLSRLAEALGSELDGAAADAVLRDFTPTYEALYRGRMRRKLGLVRRQEDEDGELISDLLQVMHRTGADFTNTFRLLSRVPWPRGEDEDEDRAAVELLLQLILEQCASVQELQRFGREAYRDNIELAMILSAAQTGPGPEGPDVAQQLELMGRLEELMETDANELKEKQRDDWIRWIGRYRRRLARESDGGDSSLIQEERVRVMNSSNPRVVLRNYIAHNAIQAAEKGDFSEVKNVLRVLEKPFSEPDPCGGRGAAASYDGKPPAWAQTLCIT